jgi:hypothetical protein
MSADAVLSPQLKFEPVPPLMLPHQSEEVAQSFSDLDNAKMLDMAIKALTTNTANVFDEAINAFDDIYYSDEDEAAVDAGDASKQPQVREGKGKVESSKVRDRKGFNVTSLSDACIQRLLSLSLSVCPFLSVNHCRL